MGKEWIGLLLIACSVAEAQKQVERKEQAWFGYFSQARLTDHSGIWVDLHHRLTDDFVRRPSISIARTAYVYYISDDVRLFAGYALARQYASTGNTWEHRPWQQVQVGYLLGKVLVLQSVRVEQRFREDIQRDVPEDGYMFNWRFRKNVSLTLPLKGRDMRQGMPFLLFSNDLHINAGKAVANNYFDQNRLSLSLGYKFSDQLNAHVGYLFVYQQMPQDQHFIHINAIKFNVVHHMDVRDGN